LVLNQDSGIRELSVINIPLGISADVKYRSASATIEQGELIIAATDGITEARQGDNFLDSGGLAEIARKSNRNLPIEKLCESVMDDVIDFAGAKLTDDACLLLASRL
jgi:serine phosphatase RsbU (regulator of sigma subunit)